MIYEAFELHMQNLTRLEPIERHRRMSALHKAVCGRYVDAILLISSTDSARTSSDGRSIALVVGHIMEWDRFHLQSAGALLSGIKKPQIFGMQGYAEPDGEILNFNSVDEFNAYQAKKQADWPWERIQSAAEKAALALLAMFTHPDLLSPAVLEAARPTLWKLPSGEQIPSTYGWRLWKTIMEHEGFEHYEDLGLKDMQSVLK